MYMYMVTSRLRRARGRPRKTKMVKVTAGNILFQRRLLKKFTPNLYKFTRLCQANPALIMNGAAAPSTTELVNATTEHVYEFKFQLSDLPDYAEFTALFDVYQITGVKVMLLPQQFNEPQSTTPAAVGYLVTAVDYDAGTALTSVNAVMEYENAKIHPFGGGQNSIIKRFLRPKTSVPVYSGSAFSNYASAEAQWIDCVNASTPYYGFLVAMPAASSDGLVKYRFACKYYLKFKNVR